MSKNKAKGTSAETAVVKYLIENGFPHAERRALSGANDQGDVSGCIGLCIEVKSHKTYKFPEWLKETEVETINAKADYGILVVKPNGVGLTNAGEFFAVMKLKDLTSLVRDAGYGNPND